MEEPSKIEEYDGIKKIKTKEGFDILSFNIYDALEQKNPRNVFLNGQLYVENSLDIIISMYFGYDNSIRHSSILEFLKSRNCDFFSKIQLLSMLINTYKPNPTGKHEVVHFIEDKKIISSLQTIGEVRNAFQHNLVFDEAFKNAIKDGKTFKLINKRLDTCNNVDDLVKMFKEEVVLLNDKLHNIILKEFSTPVKLSPESDKKEEIN
jgi:hypothetical protein